MAVAMVAATAVAVAMSAALLSWRRAVPRGKKIIRHNNVACRTPSSNPLEGKGKEALFLPKPIFLPLILINDPNTKVFTIGRRRF